MPALQEAGRRGRWSPGLLAWGVTVLIGVAGCTMPNFKSMGGMNRWFADDGATASGYKEPAPGQPTGLKRVWRQGLVGSPSKKFLHPEVMAVLGGDLLVASFKGYVFRVSQADGSVIWKADLKEEVAGGVATDGERVYVGTVMGSAVALGVSDGKEQWRRLASHAISSAPSVGGGRVVFVTLDNRTYALDAQTGDKQWMHSVPPGTLVMMGSATPTIVDKLVYVGYSSGEVYALGLEDGRKTWSENLTVMRRQSEVDTLQDVDASVLVTEKVVYAVNHQGHLLAFHRQNGSSMWSRDVSALHPPLVEGRRLYISDVNGQMTALGAEDGSMVWQSRLSDGILTAPVMVRGRLIAADNKGRLFAVDPDSGQVVGLEHLDEPVFAAPMLVDGQVFLWTNNGNLWRFQ